jgi:hypothetical protein
MYPPATPPNSRTRKRTTVMLGAISSHVGGLSLARADMPPALRLAAIQPKAIAQRQEQGRRNDGGTEHVLRVDDAIRAPSRIDCHSMSTSDEGTTTPSVPTTATVA